MKVTTLLSAAAVATTAVNAFPFLGMADLASRSEEEKRGLLDSALGGFLNNNQVKGTPFGSLLGGLKGFSSWSPEQIGSLVESMNVGFKNVTDMMAYEGRGFPEGGKSILSQPIGQLRGNDDGQPIYDAFGLHQDWPEQAPNPGGMLNDYVWGGPSAVGEHEYIRPDNYWRVRGPCPGLNTAANHGHLPRDGIVLPHELFIGTWRALSLSPELCAILAALSYMFHGDPLTLTLSISFQKDRTDVNGNARGGTGIGDHGVLEGDASVTRNDAGLSELWYGKDNANWWGLNETLYNLFQEETNGQISLMSLAKGRKRAWQIGRDNNPYFDFNPWRMIVAYGESGFTWQALKGSSPVFTAEMVEWWFKREQFPPGWRRRFVPITTPEMLAWGAVVELLDPSLPGWNLGIKSMSFLGFNLPTILGGQSSNGANYMFTGDVLSIIGAFVPFINNPGQSLLAIGCGPVKIFSSLVPTWLLGQSASGKRDGGGFGGLFDQISGLNGFSC